MERRPCNCAADYKVRYNAPRTLLARNVLNRRLSNLGSRLYHAFIILREGHIKSKSYQPLRPRTVYYTSELMVESNNVARLSMLLGIKQAEGHKRSSTAFLAFLRRSYQLEVYWSYHRGTGSFTSVPHIDACKCSRPRPNRYARSGYGPIFCA